MHLWYYLQMNRFQVKQKYKPNNKQRCLIFSFGHFKPNEYALDVYYFGRNMLKRVFGYIRTAKAQLSLRIRADQGLHCPLTELSDTIDCDCINGGQRPEWSFADAQDDLNLRIMRML